jgi:glycosyltransferase involved in cell wall biosynthesis
VSARVAVLIPCYGDGELLREAVASIDEDEPVEVVVVDDGSTDRPTLDVLAQLAADGVRVIRKERNEGVPAARMTALAETGAPYVFPLDADDQLVPGTLGRMADLLDANPDAAACFGDYLEFGTPPESLRAIPHELDPFRIAYANEFGAPLLRRSAVVEAGGWLPDGEDSKTFGYEDWHLWMSLAERGQRGVHVGTGVPTYRRRLQQGRRMASDRSRHRRVYADLRRLHPELFRRLPEHRRRSSLSPVRKLLYPVVYGKRSRRGFERRVRVWLDDRGIWTQR